MKTYIVYNDTHWWSKYSIEERYEEGAIYNGDIFDLAGCKKKDALKVYKKMMAFALRVGDKFNFGNHERQPKKLMSQYIENNIIFAHAMLELWGHERSMEYMKKPYGKGRVGRTLSAIFDKLRVLKRTRLTLEQKERFVDRCLDNNCHTFVGGHAHNRKIIDITHESRGRSIRIIILPRGRNELTI